MGRIEKPWGYEEQVLVTQVEVEGQSGMLGIRRLVINGDEITSYAKHSKQEDIIYLEKGAAVLRTEEGMKELVKGEAVTVNPGEEHQIQNIDNKVAEILEISFPYRPDDIERIEDPYNRSEEGEKD
ncbi:MAG: mannose-6-phosphate isomerase-like protein (cupin superfamily) [Colwellia polaris]|jgi:mannose-6-phosphate isomerase-like protein (cupin superfamily)